MKNIKVQKTMTISKTPTMKGKARSEVDKEDMQDLFKRREGQMMNSPLLKHFNGIE